MKSGKLPNNILSALLKHHDINNNRVKVGPQVGEDAAAIDIGDKYLLVKNNKFNFLKNMPIFPMNEVEKKKYKYSNSKKIKF